MTAGETSGQPTRTDNASVYANWWAQRALAYENGGRFDECLNPDCDRFAGERAPTIEYMPCKFCDCVTCILVAVTRNVNEGDSLFGPHVHLNLFYRCANRHDFVVRASWSPGDFLDRLYYGDIDKGRPRDMTGPAQQEMREKTLCDEIPPQRGLVLPTHGKFGPVSDFFEPDTVLFGWGVVTCPKQDGQRDGESE